MRVFSSSSSFANRQIMTFCTGGIRCVKVNAFLKQKLGYENVASLRNGIIGYQKWVDEQVEEGAGNGQDDGNSDSHNNDNSKNIRRKIDTNRRDVISLFNGETFLFDRRRLPEDDNREEE